MGNSVISIDELATGKLPIYYRRESSEIFKYVTYFIFVFNILLNQSGLVESPVLSYLIIALSPFCLDSTRYNYRLFLLFSLLLLYGTFHAIVNIFLIFYIVYLFRNYSIRKLAKYTVVLYIFFVIYLFVMLNTGILSDITIHYDKGLAHTFGFKNSNSAGLQILYFCIALYVAFQNKNKTFMFLFLFSILAFNQIMYELIYSRTTWISVIALCLCGLLNQIGFINKKTQFLFVIFPLILTVIIFLVLLNPIEFYYIDDLFSGRIGVLSETILFMSPRDWIVGRAFEGVPIDCAYLGMIYIGGILWFLFFMCALLKALIAKFQKIIPYLPVIVAMLVGGMCENTFCSSSSAAILLWLIILCVPYQTNSLYISEK